MRLAVAGGTSGKLLPAYLFVGTDELRQRDSIEDLKKRLEAAGGDPAFNTETYSGDAAPEPDELRASLDTLPFMSDFRLVVLTSVDKAPKPVVDEITKYLDNPNPSTVLAMTAQKLASNLRIYKAIAKMGPGAIVECVPPKKAMAWEIAVGIAGRHGLTLDRDAAMELVARLGDSTLAIDNESKKLATAFGCGRRLTKADVAANVERVVGFKPWDVADAMCRRDAATVVRMVDSANDDDMIGLFSYLVGRLRELVAAKTLALEGRPGDLAMVLGQPDWKVKNHAGWARNFEMGELLRAMEDAADCDVALKSQPDKRLALTRWVLSLCGTTR